MSEWISVTDRLPRDCGYYLVSICDDCDLGWDDTIAWTAFYNAWPGQEVPEYWDMCSPLTDGLPVTHWMPLPEPPEATP